jgi:hypothetical protein
MSDEKPFIARVRLPNGSVQKIEVRADHVGNARAMWKLSTGRRTSSMLVADVAAAAVLNCVWAANGMAVLGTP